MYITQFRVSPYLGEYLMSKSNIAKQLAQVQPGTLHAGIDLALEKNVVVVINEKAEQLDHFSFPQDRGGFDYFLQRVEGLRQKYQASEIAVAMEPSNNFWKLLAREWKREDSPITGKFIYSQKTSRRGSHSTGRRMIGEMQVRSQNSPGTANTRKPTSRRVLMRICVCTPPYMTSQCKPFDARSTFSGDWSGKPSRNCPEYSRTWVELRARRY